MYEEVKIMCINPNFIVNQENKKVAVQLDIETYNQITKTLEDFALYKIIEETDNTDSETLSMHDAKAYYKSLKEYKAS